MTCRNFLVGYAELRDSVIALAAELAAGAPLAVRSTRATMRADLLRDVPALICEKILVDALGLEPRTR